VLCYKNDSATLYQPVMSMNNFFLTKRSKGDKRTPEQIREHYEIEKSLANKLRNATREERQYLYTTLYDELFRRVPLHPQLTHKEDRKSQYALVSIRMALLKRFLKHESTFLEVGSGDCALSLEVANHAQKVYAVDVSEHITENELPPQNFNLIISDGFSIPVPENSISVAYSDQLLEHLHPEDAFDHLRNIYKALCPGGIYICITPNRLSGPHDVSKYFDDVATGFHLKEYTVTELRDLFRRVGFVDIDSYIGGKGLYIKFPLFITALIEKFLSVLKFPLRRKIANALIIRKLLNVAIVGKKCSFSEKYLL